MKSNIFIITVTCLTMLFASCTTMNVNNVNKGETLKGGWGYVIARVINPTAGKTVPFFKLDGEVYKYYELNSDIKFENRYYGFSPFELKNNEAPVQLYFLKARKGTYYIYEVGKNSMYKPVYSFYIEEGKINYIGDFYLDVIRGTISNLTIGRDWYDLTVKDKFSDLSDFDLSEYKQYETVNASFEYKNEPWTSPVERSDVSEYTGH